MDETFIISCQENLKKSYSIPDDSVEEISDRLNFILHCSSLGNTNIANCNRFRKRKNGVSELNDLVSADSVNAKLTVIRKAKRKK